MAKVKSIILPGDQSLGAIMREKYSEDGLFETDINLGTFNSGFPTLDYRLAFPVDIYKKDEWIAREIAKGVLCGSYLMIVGDSGTGKAEPYSRKIPTPTGTKLMGELQVGDSVFGQDGKPTTVTDIFEQGVKDVYRITFNDGRTAECELEHLWKVIVGETESVKPLKEIMIDYKDIEYKIQLNDPVQYESQVTSADPLALGHTIAKELHDQLIPDQYIFNSVLVRLRLIQGMLSDNFDMLRDIFALKTGRLTLSEPLMEQVRYIIWSLGGDAIIHLDDRTGQNTLDWRIPFLCAAPDLPKLTIKDIQFMRQEKCRCIMVDNPEHLYLTEDFVVTHNSTIATQIASNIARPYEYSLVDHRDLERSAILPHVIQLSKLPRSDFDISNPNYRYILSQKPADHETLQKIILRYWREKMANKEKYLIQLDQRNEYGDKIITMQPTVMIIDSVPMIGHTLDFGDAKDVKKMEVLLSQMDAAQSAGAFKRMIKTVLGPMKEANIILIGVSHIGQKIASNPMIHNKKDFRGLGQDEIIAGGKMNTYGAMNIIKTDRRSGKGYTIENGDGFNGFDAMITVVKTRTTVDGQLVPMIYDCDNGFDAIRSMIQYGIERGIITGNRASMKFTNDPECKFSGTRLYEDIRTKPEIGANLKKFIIPDLESNFKIEKQPETIMNIFVDY